MRAIAQSRYGPPEEVLRLVELPEPVGGEGEVLVRVKATSVHADVWHSVAGRPMLVRSMAGWRRPRARVPGTDLAGVVEAVGDGVTRFRPGDAVFGVSALEMSWKNGGTWAELAAVPEGALAVKPTAVSFDAAAAVGAAGWIALLNLRGPAAVGAGAEVLINGAGGAVGSIALQVLKSRGARVTAVDRADKLEMLLELGADRAVDYQQEDPTAGPEPYDLVFDVASTLRLRNVKRVLTPSGIYVMIGHDHYGAKGGPLLGTMPSFFGTLLRGLWDRHLPRMGSAGKPPPIDELMETLRELLESGRLTPVVERALPLGEATAAMRALCAGETSGRIVLCP